MKQTNPSVTADLFEIPDQLHFEDIEMKHSKNSSVPCHNHVFKSLPLLIL